MLGSLRTVAGNAGSMDHRYHADFASFNTLISEKVKDGTFTEKQAREKLTQYRELVKAQYKFGRSGNLSLDEENERVMEQVIKESEKNDPAVRNMTTVTSADDDDEISSLSSRLSLDSSSSCFRSSSISSVDSSTSGDSDDDGLGFSSSESRFTSVSPPLFLSLVLRRGIVDLQKQHHSRGINNNYSAILTVTVRRVINLRRSRGTQF